MGKETKSIEINKPSSLETVVTNQIRKKDTDEIRKIADELFNLRKQHTVTVTSVALALMRSIKKDLKKKIPNDPLKRTYSVVFLCYDKDWVGSEKEFDALREIIFKSEDAIVEPEDFIKYMNDTIGSFCRITEIQVRFSQVVVDIEF